jgi:hypothetical protein
MPAGIPAMTALANITVSGTPTTITFSSINSTYRDLILVASPLLSGANEIRARLNGDTGSNYAIVETLGNGSSASSYTSTYNGISLAIYGGTAAQNQIIDFLDYSVTDKHKMALIRNNEPASGVTGKVQRWANTAAINSITLFTTGGTFVAGSTFALYGVSA